MLLKSDSIIELKRKLMIITIQNKPTFQYLNVNSRSIQLINYLTLFLSFHYEDLRIPNHMPNKS